MIVLWIVVLAASLILEAATFALISIWFAAGAVGALIAAAMGAPVIWQLVIFVFLAGLLLIFTRPLLKKLFPSKFIPTNSELEVGKTAVVIETIDNASGKGRVRLGGVNWAASSSSGDGIGEGEVVRVTEVRSAKLIVERDTPNTENK